jgi:phosphocarrier protein
MHTKGMISVYIKTARIDNEVGLHARPATFFIQKANEFKSNIWVEKEDRRVNAKSLLGVLSLGIMKGTEITLIGDGPDEVKAIETLLELIGNNFTE